MEVSSPLPYTEPESPRLFGVRLGGKGTDKPMKISTLREFVALAKNRSFVQAAKELYVSQPSLSAHIAALEKDLGFTLADREGGHFVLTPAGMSFLEYAQSAVRGGPGLWGPPHHLRGHALQHVDPRLSE